MGIFNYLIKNPIIKTKLDLMSKDIKEEYLEKLSDISIFLTATNEEVEDLDLGSLLSNPDDIEQNDLSDNQFTLSKLIANLAQITKFKEASDTDSDGKLTEKELNEALLDMMDNDGNKENLTLDDIDKLLEEYEITAEELFQDDFDELFEDKITDFFKNEENIDDVEGPNDQYSQEFFEKNGDSSVNLAMGNPKGNPQPKKENYSNLDGMSIEQLKAEEGKRKNALQEKQDAVNAVHNGENPKVKAAIEEEATAKEAYEEALSEDSTPEIKELLNEQKENDKAIQDNKTQLTDANTTVNNTEVELSNQKNTVTGLKNELNSLKSSLAALPSPTGKPEDAKRDAEIAQKKAAIEAQISTKETEVNDAETKQQEIEKSLDEAKTHLEDLEATKTELESTRTEIENNIMSVATEQTQQALSTYQEARTNVDSVKSSELSAAKTEQTNALNALKEVTQKINEKEVSKTKRENSINMGDDVAAFAMSLKGMSEDQIRSYIWKNYNEGKEWKDQCPFNNGGYCADFVYFAWRMTVGDEGLPDWYRNCENFSFPANIDRKARAAGALRDFSTRESVVNTVKPGDLITYGNHVEGEGGHIGMIAEVKDDGTIITIEGNTVPYGSVNSHEIKYEQFAQKNVHQIISMDS